jgi:hypothetical protein
MSVTFNSEQVIMKKYTFTGEARFFCGVTLNRIVCVTAFGSVSAGTVGGWVEGYKNLSHSGDAWVSDNACALDNAWIYDNACISDNACASGNAKVYDNAKVCGNARVCDNSSVCGDSRISGRVWVSDNARVSGYARVTRNPTTLNAPYYHITITDKHLQLNSEIMTIGRWKRSSRAQLLKINDKIPADAWFKHKELIISLAEDQNGVTY